MDPHELMRLAIESCRQGLEVGQSPFGCAIAIGDRVLASSHNTVLLTTDITAHAEVNAIRAANLELGDIFLEGAMVATTCEPCPMCMAALHWARVETVYFGAGICDAGEAGFNELQLPAERLLELGGSQVKLVGGLLRAECRELFAQWKASPQARSY